MIRYKFSLITPTHKASPHLLELYQSICKQTYEEWEWVLWLNNGFDQTLLPISIREDKRVKTHISQDDNVNIGHIKNEAFRAGDGDILVEVDHDDLLIPDCLKELNKAFQDEEVGFVYSDNAKLSDDFIPYKEKNGWVSYPFEWDSKELCAMRSFGPSSQALSYIWYCPDHVRAWRASVYKELGGHNPELEVCDDHELLIRTYLKHKFYHIPKVLYIYRITGDNTWLLRNSLIQTKTVELFYEYGYQLAERDAELKGLIKVDLGGGLFPREGYTTIDQEDADIITNLDEGIPLEDNSVGVLNASHILEHLKDPIKSMREIHRVLCHGGWAMIEIPSTEGRGAFQDPTHVSYWNENSFHYYTKVDQAQFIRNTSIRFQTFRLQTHFPTEWCIQNDVPVVTAWLSCVKEGERLPHILDI